MTHKIILLTIVTFGILSCGRNPQKQPPKGSYYAPTYAKGFCIDTVDNQKILVVLNPFQNTENVRYRYTVGGTTAKKVICMSTTHIALLDFIGETGSIAGISGAGYVYNHSVKARCRQGAIADVGYDAGLNYERILALQPDVVFAYGVSGEMEAIGKKLQELGVTVVYLGEYTEEHPLGKAEWVVAISTFFGQEKLAIEKFNAVADEYNKLKKLTEKIEKKTPVLLNAPWSGVWYVPGKHSNMASYLADAGGESVIALNSQRDSYPVSIEHAYSSAQKASLWLNPGRVQTLAELSSMSKLIADIPVFGSGNVYNNNARSTPQGGSDFFESGVVNPHIVLRDLITILHPEVADGKDLFYYTQLR
ncbi:MAG: ABC transporter substrate-binding protein [Prevotellaceae bacterium]|jgi:iron complex transport system substrate-binding protein|nr:ABC transporter substrate-binding protein [Prevotellaceae bacterium]